MRATRAARSSRLNAAATLLRGAWHVLNLPGLPPEPAASTEHLNTLAGSSTGRPAEHADPETPMAVDRPPRRRLQLRHAAALKRTGLGCTPARRRAAGPRRRGGGRLGAVPRRPAPEGDREAGPGRGRRRCITAANKAQAIYANHPGKEREDQLGASSLRAERAEAQARPTPPQNPNAWYFMVGALAAARASAWPRRWPRPAKAGALETTIAFAAQACRRPHRAGRLHAEVIDKVGTCSATQGAETGPGPADA